MIKKSLQNKLQININTKTKRRSKFLLIIMIIILYIPLCPSSVHPLKWIMSGFFVLKASSTHLHGKQHETYSDVSVD